MLTDVTANTPVPHDKYAVARDDYRLLVPKTPIAFDVSNTDRFTNIYPPQSQTAVGTNGLINTNGDGKTTFMLDVASTEYALDPMKSYLMIEMRFPKYDAALTTESNYAATDSAPYDAAFRMIKQIQISTASAGNNLEEYTGSHDFGRLCQIKHLLELDRTTAEGMDDMFFTPCIESVLDTTVALSPESTARTAKWFTDRTVRYERHIPLSMIFASMDRPVLLTNMKMLKITIDWRKMNEYQFGTTTNSGVDAYSGYTCIGITACNASLTRSKMSMLQGTKNTLMAKESPEIYGYLLPQLFPQAFNGTPMTLGVKANVNLITISVPPTPGAADFVQTAGPRLVNPSQLVPTMTTVGAYSWGTNFANVNVQYGACTFPIKPIDLSQAQQAARMYALYREASGFDGSKFGQPMISFTAFRNCYQLLCFPIYDTKGFKCTDTPQNVTMQIYANGDVNRAKTSQGKMLDMIMHIAQVYAVSHTGTISKMLESS